MAHWIAHRIVVGLLAVGTVAASPAMVLADGQGSGTITESTDTREILESADTRIAEANQALADLQAYMAELDPQSDTLAAEIRDLSITLAEVRGFVAVAEQHRVQLEAALGERSTRWTAAVHHYEMVLTASSQAVNRVAGVLQQSSQASRYTGERSLVASVDQRIPERDVTGSGELDESLDTVGVDDRGVDSPVF